MTSLNYLERSVFLAAGFVLLVLLGDTVYGQQNPETAGCLAVQTPHEEQLPPRRSMRSVSCPVWSSSDEIRSRSSAFSFSRMRIIPSRRLSSCWIVSLSSSSVMYLCFAEGVYRCGDWRLGLFFCMIAVFQNLPCSFDSQCRLYGFQPQIEPYP